MEGPTKLFFFLFEGELSKIFQVLYSEVPAGYVFIFCELRIRRLYLDHRSCYSERSKMIVWVCTCALNKHVTIPKKIRAVMLSL